MLGGLLVVCDCVRFAVFVYVGAAINSVDLSCSFMLYWFLFVFGLY